jgi:putative ABC transport system permease protein
MNPAKARDRCAVGRLSDDGASSALLGVRAIGPIISAGGPHVNSIIQDLRFAARRLVRDRRFTLAAIAALALGIGATSAVFTIVNAILLRSLPFNDPDRVMWISTRDAQDRDFGASLHDFEDWRRASRTFSGLALVSGASLNFSADDRATEQYPGAYISANGFAIIGARPAIGRAFTEEDDRPGAPAVVLLGHSVWQNRYGGDPSVIGRTIRVNTMPAAVVGVMPDDVKFPFNTEAWLPMSQIPPVTVRGRQARYFIAYGRLADGRTREQAQSEMSNITAQLAKEYPDTNKDVSAVVTPYAERAIGRQIRIIFWSLMGAVGFVLLIACANVANLLLARAADRSREMAVRLSIGATRWRIVRQLLVESVLLAFVSGVAGLSLAYAGVRWFDANTQDVGKPYWMVFSMDASVFAFFAGVCLATGIIFGLAPALYVSRTNVNDVLKDGGRSGSAGTRARRWTTSLIVAELTLTLVLLAGAGFMMRSFLHLYRMDIGIDTAPLVTMSLVFPPLKYPTVENRVAFLQRVSERLNGIGAIEGATTANYLPFSGGSTRRLWIEGRPEQPPGKEPTITMIAAGSRYFDVLGAPILRGRAFVATDGEPGREAAVINERLAALHFRGEDPIGRRIRLLADGNLPDAPKFYAATIVGMAPTIRQRGSEPDPDPIVYIPHRQDLLMGFQPGLIVRTRSNPGAAVTLLRREIGAMDADIPLTNIRTLDETLARSRWPQRVFGTMFSTFAIIAVVLAAVGLYGVTAYSVSQRTQEIGIRMALGADTSQVRWLVLRRGIFQLGIGLTLGLAGAFGVGKLLQSLLVQTGPADPVTLLSISAVLTTVGVAACVWPARRAARLDPVKALRYE